MAQSWNTTGLPLGNTLNRNKYFELVDDKLQNNEANLQDILNKFSKKELIDLIKDFRASQSIFSSFIFWNFKTGFIDFKLSIRFLMHKGSYDQQTKEKPISDYHIYLPIKLSFWVLTTWLKG